MVVVVGASLAPLLYAPRGHAEGDTRAAPQSAAAGQDLDEELKRLKRAHDLPESAGAPLALAQRALNRARSEADAGNPEAAARARRIATAALSLADRRLMYAREQGELRAARRRQKDASLRAKRAKQALAAERARVSELQKRQDAQ